MVRMTKRKAIGVVALAVVAAILLIAFMPTFDEGKIGDWEARAAIAADAYVASSRRADSFGDGDFIVVASVTESMYLSVRYVSVMDWERLPFVENNTVTSVELNLLQIDTVTVSAEGDPMVVCPTYSDWNGESANWNTVDVSAWAYFQDACSSIPVDASLNWFRLDITDLVNWEMPIIATLPITSWFADEVGLSGRLFGYERDKYGATRIWFEYWEEGDNTNTTDSSVTTSAGRFGTLIPTEYNTTYYYRAMMSHNDDVYAGGILSFSTCLNIYDCEEDDFTVRDSSGNALADGNDFPKEGWGDDTVLPTGLQLMVPYGYHAFASKNHNRPEMRPYVAYKYFGPKILTPGERQHTFFWLMMLVMAAPMGVLVYFLGKRFVMAVMFHWREEYDREAAKWLNRVNRFDYDPRDYGVFGGEDEEDKE